MQLHYYQMSVHKIKLKFIITKSVHVIKHKFIITKILSMTSNAILLSPNSLQQHLILEPQDIFNSPAFRLFVQHFV